MVSVPLSPTAPPDVPPHLYQHPDPLLRRLRLESPSGVPITDIRAYFQDKKVIVFYFGGVWGVGAGLAKGLHLVSPLGKGEGRDEGRGKRRQGSAC
jgi:hypothetical protein